MKRRDLLKLGAASGATAVVAATGVTLPASANPVEVATRVLREPEPPGHYQDPLPAYRFRAQVGQGVLCSRAILLPNVGAVMLESGCRGSPALPTAGEVGDVAVELVKRDGSVPKTWRLYGCGVLSHAVDLDASESRVAAERIVLVGTRMEIVSADAEVEVSRGGQRATPAEVAAALALYVAAEPRVIVHTPDGTVRTYESGVAADET